MNKAYLYFCYLGLLMCILCLIMYVQSKQFYQVALFTITSMYLIHHIYKHNSWLYVFCNRLVAFIVNKPVKLTAVCSVNISRNDNVLNNINKVLSKKAVISELSYKNKGYKYIINSNCFQAKLQISSSNKIDIGQQIIFRFNCITHHRKIANFWDEIIKMQNDMLDHIKVSSSPKYAFKVKSRGDLFNPFYRLTINKADKFNVKFNYKDSTIKSSLNSIVLSSHNKQQVGNLVKSITSSPKIKIMY
ncbi:hypothetical protein DY052_06145 [Apilactobacillus timberlakei]|uniref:hypothetical protein n=1 Tax=Apilactobacillus timberlakei TaxID=2008380 RepID=UPI0011263605|nr:hypothetical protein [Apilactobacillus timberlakei]TPR15005.1 hypothetical protein DY052_06145 [Apilactobacillus timberlakei]